MLYSLNFAIAHAQKRLLSLSEFVTLVLHITQETVLSLEASSEINFEFIKFVKTKQNGKCLPLTKTNREYYINITFLIG